ncbi:hypothetical protein PSHT_07567 [Puccinia striiformis]|uniref:Conserved oligomeric Golgi complex subunit 6 n=1 Tax=Puccinia striiformis TaxID=27350 RepID=A0A2S4VWL8_9BASI|nr:hypothetical protein PSHT_07567 [Puccinia striiformis]
MSSQASSNPVSQRVSKLLATTQFDHPDIQAALDTLNAITFDDDQHSSGEEKKVSDGDRLRPLRKGGLRRIVENRIRNHSREFLNVFSELNNDLVDLQSNLDQMNECFEIIQSSFNTATSATKYLLEHTDKLMKEELKNEREAIAAKQIKVKKFREKFELKEEEISALTSRSMTMNIGIIEAMEHCEQIRSDCASLLSGQSPEEGEEEYQSEDIGLEIMKVTSQYLDKGYEKLLKWSISQARSGLVSKSDEIQPDVSPLMKRAINRLKSRPELFDEVINTLSTARSSSLSTLFLEALIRGGASGLPRPIELNAHDPIRYVGDMLAWIHQVMASEHEFLESLLDLKSDNRRVGQSRIFPSSLNKEDETIDEHHRPQGSSSELTVMMSSHTIIEANNQDLEDRELARKLLDTHLQGCIRPLKIRVLQTVNSQEGSLIACQLASLLEFYQGTMASTIGPDAKLTQTLTELTDQAYQVFYQLLRTISGNYLRRLEPAPVDLSVPVHIQEAMSNLRVIMSIYEGSNDGHSQNSSLHSFDNVVDLVVDPLLEGIDKMALLRTSDWDRSIFWLNCLEFILTTLEDSNSLITVQKLDGLHLTHLEKLINQYTVHLIHTSGLEAILKVIETKDPEIPLSRIPETNSKSISECLRKFDQFLTNFDPLLSSNKLLSLLNPSAIRKSFPPNHPSSDDDQGKTGNLKEFILKKSLNNLVDKYRLIYDLVSDPSNLFEFKSTILIRSLDEVKTLIGVL